MIAVEHIGPRKCRVIEIEAPSPAHGEVIVDIYAGGICGSDLHVYRRGPGIRSTILGHEPSGVVSQVGDGVEHLRVGDRVSVYHYESCNICTECRRGELHWCPELRAAGVHFPGSCASQIRIKAINALPLDHDLSFEEGALIACGAGTSWSAMRKIQPTAEDRAVVFGLGPVGLCGVAMLSAFGAEVLAIGRRSSRLALAESLGATNVIDIDTIKSSADPEAAVVEEIRRQWPSGATLGYETSGQPVAQRQLIKCLGFYGRAAVVGLGNRQPAISLSELAYKQIRICGSHVMNFADYESLISFTLKKRLNLDRIVTHRVPYSEGADAFRIADKSDCGKVVLIPD